jgi:hypothetical protein
LASYSFNASAKKWSPAVVLSVGSLQTLGRSENLEAIARSALTSKGEQYLRGPAPKILDKVFLAQRDKN